MVCAVHVPVADCVGEGYWDGPGVSVYWGFCGRGFFDEYWREYQRYVESE